MSSRSFLSRQHVLAMLLGTAMTAWTAAPASAEESAVRDLSRYCTACWRNAGLPIDRWADCTQEVLCQLLQRLPKTDWPEVLTGRDEEKRREFLPRDRPGEEARAAREEVRPARSGAIADSRFEDDLTDDREEVWAMAFEILTPRQQHILLRAPPTATASPTSRPNSTCPQRISDESTRRFRNSANVCRFPPDDVAEVVRLQLRNMDSGPHLKSYDFSDSTIASGSPEVFSFPFDNAKSKIPAPHGSATMSKLRRLHEKNRPRTPPARIADCRWPRRTRSGRVAGSATGR